MLAKMIDKVLVDAETLQARVKELGIGPDPIPQKKLTAGRLASAIRTAVTDPGIKQRAAACGAAVRATDGIGEAVQIVRRYFGEPRTGESERDL